MLNAGPTLTFDGASSAERGTTGKKIPRPERSGESFASYLKAEQPRAKTRTAQTVPGAVAAAYKAAQAGVPENTRPASAMRSRPEGLIVKNAPAPAKPALYAEPAPEGTRTSVTEAPARRTNVAADATRAATQRMPASALRISGRPITGRNGIGMVDTRKRATGDEASGVAASALASPRRNTAVFAAHTSATGQDTYARFGRHSGNGAGYSFLTEGFASKSAETALRKLGYDMRRPDKVETRATLLDTASARGTARAGIFPEAEAARAAENRRKITLASGRDTRRSALPTLPVISGNEIGALAAKFESGEEGIAAVGYDGKGGTSYGKFQIASRVGTMRAFIGYLRDKAPDLADRLSACGPANTGSRSGRMPTEWRKIAAEQPERFEQLQSEFIRTSHFEPAVAGIAGVTGVSFDKLPPVLREVLFSTAVQHGPAGAVRIVSRAMAKVNPDKLQTDGMQGSTAAQDEGRRLITQIYALRAGNFTSSSPGIREAVYNRLKLEMRDALEMLA
ncbi:MAG: hypothetical protein LBR82_02845 [Desulfovibrio sp.]|jgi:hypothetical protein|nr:hypothetical protein [Desulfovibrio sp.]